LIVVAGLACASAHTRPSAPATDARPGATWSDEAHAAFAVYAQHGLIVVPFFGVGQFFFLAAPTPDSTRVRFVVSYMGAPSEGWGFELERGGTTVHSFRVPPSTSVFQETITLAPGRYQLWGVGEERPVIVVPRLGAGSLASPVPTRNGDVLPRSTAIIGRDTAIDLSIEAYAASSAPITLSAPGWCDTIASGTVTVPLQRLGLGETTLTVARGRDSVTTPVFVGFGVPTAVSFQQLVDVLRYFPPAERLRREPRAWATLWEQSREPLLNYLDRVREANRRYRDEGMSGWETDRARVYIQLGDPDQVFVEPDIQIWVYTRYFGRLKFDHKRLVPGSQAMLDTLVARERSAR
jgi:hypothetical protein